MREFHTTSSPRVRTAWPKLTLGVVAVFLAFDRAGAALDSGRGESGGLLALLVLSLLVLVEALLFGRRPKAALAALGLGRPAARGLVIATAVSSLLAALMPLCVLAAGGDLGALLPGWPLLLLGMFLQHGVAEETLFRGFLFGHVREGRAFWPAAWRAMVPFAAAHAPLFLLMPAPVAAAAAALAVATSFPLSRLYDEGGRTIWAPAIVHTVINSVKLLDLNGSADIAVFATLWTACAAAVPFLAFAVPHILPRRLRHGETPRSSFTARR